MGGKGGSALPPKKVIYFILIITIKIKMSKIFQDDIHGPIEICLFGAKIIDTPEFQRLRNIKQLGSGYYVFPSASHNRFEHSIGTAYLARSLINEIATNQPELDITPEQKINVELAGLCHDLGHGPFSHIYDDIYLKDKIPDDHPFRHHEQRSCAILAMINDKYNIGISIENIKQIQIMIHPEREKDKSNFLFQIVSNGKNGIDVDKFDYIARDTKALGIHYGFDHKRIFPYCKVIQGEICYCNKIIFNIFELFDTRYRLHKQVYNHPTVKRVDMTFAKIFVRLEKILPSFDKPFENEMLTNFLKLTDSIMDFPFLIDDKWISDDKLHILYDIRSILNDLKTRNLEVIIEAILMKTGDKSNEVWKNWCLENNKDPDEYIYSLRKLSFSAGTRNPLNYVKFFIKNTNELMSRKEINTVMGSILPKQFEEKYLLIFRK